MRTTLAAAAVLIAAVVALAYLLLPADTPARADTPAPIAQGGTATLSGPDAAVLAAAAPGGEALSPAQAEAALLTADRVCDGLTAAVPEGVMIRGVADEGGLTLDLAHAFVEAAIARCTR